MRVHMAHPVNAAARTIAFSEVQVYAAVKRPPRAVFEYGPKPLDVAETATFDASRSAAGDSPIQRYEWDLDGDGSFETDTGTTATATKAYGETGRYRVGLRATDADGEQDEFRALVLVARDVEIFDLGTTAPDDSGAAHATEISPRGAVAVTMGHSGELDQQPGRYQGGAVRPLELPPGQVFGTVWEVNDAGQAVGSTYPSQPVHPGRRHALEQRHADDHRHARRRERDRGRPQHEWMGGRLGARRPASSRAATSSGRATRWSTCRRRRASRSTSARP